MNKTTLPANTALLTKKQPLFSNMSVTMIRFTSLIALAMLLSTHALASAASKQPFHWDNATIYFLLTDRFLNADPSNDLMLDRKADGAPLRGFLGGDFKGITQKIEEGYFNELGVNAIWLTPHVEQIKYATDESTGWTYGFHGYWASDWTTVDPNYGTTDDLKALVDAAHAKDIRVLFDIVINHTGPVTPLDKAFPESWVRKAPKCSFKDPKSTIQCNLVENLPDIRTESNKEVELPPVLAEKWKKEGRYEQEMKELDEFFARTKLPRAPRFYLMKWHMDWIREYGVDGFRVDTVKHVEASVWREFNDLARAEFETWKQNNPEKKLSDDPFYITGEVFNYGIQAKNLYWYNSEDTVDFFAHGFDSLINFSLKGDIRKKSYEEIFKEYGDLLEGKELKPYNVVNYVTSHDDKYAFDRERKEPFKAANALMLTPGAVQIYYGDESARLLNIEEAKGDARFRSMMNWDEIKKNTKRNGYKVKDVLKHWQTLGQFRQRHISVGAGIHKKIDDAPFTFSRSFENDAVVVAMELPKGKKHKIKVGDIFKDGEKVRDFYTGKEYKVKGGIVKVKTKHDLILLEKAD